MGIITSVSAQGSPPILGYLQRSFTGVLGVMWKLPEAAERQTPSPSWLIIHHWSPAKPFFPGLSFLFTEGRLSN